MIQVFKALLIEATTATLTVAYVSSLRKHYFFSFYFFWRRWALLFCLKQQHPNRHILVMRLKAFMLFVYSQTHPILFQIPGALGCQHGEQSVLIQADACLWTL